MSVKRYNPSLHKHILVGWLNDWGIPVPDDQLFSDYGLIVDEIAIGFLFSTCSKQFYIDHFVTDRDTSLVQRDEAIIVLLKELEREAKRRGALVVTILASLDSMRSRACKLHYKHAGEFGFYFKEL